MIRNEEKRGQNTTVVISHDIAPSRREEEDAVGTLPARSRPGISTNVVTHVTISELANDTYRNIMSYNT